jgi:hypothetical protein
MAQRVAIIGEWYGRLSCNYDYDMLSRFPDSQTINHTGARSDGGIILSFQTRANNAATHNGRARRLEGSFCCVQASSNVVISI